MTYICNIILISDIPVIVLSPTKAGGSGPSQVPSKPDKGKGVRGKELAKNSKGKENKMDSVPGVSKPVVLKSTTKTVTTKPVVKHATVITDTEKQARRPRSTSSADPTASGRARAESKSRSKSVVTNEAVSVDKVSAIEAQMSKMAEVLRQLAQKNKAVERQKPVIQESQRREEPKLFLEEDPVDEEEDFFGDVGLDWASSIQPAALRNDEMRSAPQVVKREPMKNKRWTEGDDASSTTKIRRILAEPPQYDEAGPSHRSTQHSGGRQMHNDYDIMGCAPIRDVNGKLIKSKPPLCCTVTYSGLHQRRMRESGEVSNLQCGTRDDLMFLRQVLMETMSLRGFLDEAVRRLYMMTGPSDIRSVIHSAMDDLMSGKKL